MSLATQGPDCVICPMREEDLPAVMRVEIQVYSYPWTEGIFHDCLRAGYYCQTLWRAGEIVGYGVMSAAAGECHILNLCVHPRARRRGLGRTILHCLLAGGRSRNADTAFLEVRVSNRAALDLYAVEGFCEVGVRRGYYPLGKGHEDAVVMACSL